MPKNPEVDAWFKELDHPLKDAMLRVRSVILAADRRVTETIKWKSPTFLYEGNIASIEPRAKKHVSVLFHQGASLPGKHPKLEGGGATVRYMRFTGLAEVRTKEKDLKAAVRAWCDLKAKGR